MNALTDWWDLARDTVLNPRSGARRILQMQLPLPVLLQVLALVSIVTDLLIFIEAAAGGGGVLLLYSLNMTPVVMAVMQFASLVVVALAIWGIGRAFGGKGDWLGALALVAWLQAIMVGLSVAQTVLSLLVPPLAGLVAIGSLLLTLWLITNFTAELHGFANLWAVFFGILVSGFVLIFGLSSLLVASGVMLPGVP